MNPQSDLFTNIYSFLEKGFDAANGRGIHNYTLGSMNKHDHQRKKKAFAENEPPKSSGSGYEKLWMRSGHELNYQKYSTVPRIADRNSIQHELSNMLPYYKTYSPYQLSVEPPKPIPTMPQFRNEFANWRIEKPRQLDGPVIPPPPAKTTGVKHCKFCKKNGEHPDMYMSHQLFNDKELVCPILATFTCANCKEKGHTR